MDKKIYTAIISSVKNDFENYRQVAINACNKARILPISSIDHNISNEEGSSKESSILSVNEADIYIGIISPRYGSIPKDETINYVEIEYNRALEKGIERFIFQVSDNLSMKYYGNVKQSGDINSAEHQKFIEKLNNNDTVNKFDNLEQLKSLISHALTEWRQKQKNATPLPPESTTPPLRVSNKIFEDTSLEKYISNSRIIIFNDETELKIDTLKKIDALRQKGIKHIYINSNKESIKDYLKDYKDDYISFIKNINEIPDIKKFDLIICSKISDLQDNYSYWKKTRKLVTIFPSAVINNYDQLFLQMLQYDFKDRLSLTKNSFSASVYREDDTNIDKIDLYQDDNNNFFTNRGPDFNKFRAFNSSDSRLVKILGIKGIGKKSFINELKKKGIINQPLLEYSFLNDEENIYQLLKELCEEKIINVSYKQPNNIRELDKLINSFILKFNKLKNGKIIFYNVDKIIDRTGKFIDRDIAMFFERIIEFNNKRNKVILVSDRNFKIYKNNSDNLYTSSILLSNLNLPHIQFILEWAFYKLNKPGLAQSIVKGGDRGLKDKLEEFIQGHPELAIRFATAAEKFTLKTIINDARFKEEIISQKINYLMSIINFTEEEGRLLNYLALTIEKSIDRELLIRILDKEKLLTSVVDDLEQKLFIHSFIEQSIEKYKIDAFCKSTIEDKLTPKVSKDINLFLADYYFMKVGEFQDNLYDNTIKKENYYYRHAEYHYINSGDKLKIQTLILQKTSNFLDKARLLGKSKDSNHARRAWEYYNTIYNGNFNSLKNHDIGRFVYLTKKIRQTISIDKILEDPELNESPAILNNCAGYYIYVKNYKKAKLLAEQAIDITESRPDKKNRYIAQDLRAQATAFMGNQDQAVDYFIAKIDEISSLRDKYEEVRTYMNWFKILDVEQTHFKKMGLLYKYFSKISISRQQLRTYINTHFCKEQISEINSMYNKAILNQDEVSNIKNDFIRFNERFHLQEKYVFKNINLFNTSKFNQLLDEMNNLLDKGLKPLTRIQKLNNKDFPSLNSIIKIKIYKEELLIIRKLIIDLSTNK